MSRLPVPLLHTPEVVPLASLRPHARNYQAHPEEELAHLRQSLQEHGWYRNVVIAQDDTILAGHGVVAAALALGWTHGPAVRLPLAADHPQALKVLVGDNEIRRLGLLHDPALINLLEDIATNGAEALLGTGFDEASMQALLESVSAGNGLAGGNAEADVEPQIDRAEELREQWGVEVGQVWALGEHRVICGDCTDKAVLVRLLDQVTPDVLINDPPYGMRLDADFSGMTSKLRFAREKHVFGGRRYKNVLGDHDNFDAAPLRQLVRAIPEQFWFGADYYAASLGDTQHTGSWLVWDKRLDETMDRMYGSCFELLWSQQKHKRDILRHRWAGVFGTEAEPQKRREHPNQKPLALFEDLLCRYATPDAIVLDCFAGAGSLLLACQRLSFRSYSCEIDPGYVAVTLERWHQLTGEQPVLMT